jgi:hypothetical protein
MARANLIKLLLGGLCLAILLAGAGWLWLAHVDRERLDRPVPGLEAARAVVIETGSSLGGVAHSLAAQGLLEYPESFVRPGASCWRPGSMRANTAWNLERPRGKCSTCSSLAASGCMQ